MSMFTFIRALSLVVDLVVKYGMKDGVVSYSYVKFIVNPLVKLNAYRYVILLKRIDQIITLTSRCLSVPIKMTLKRLDVKIAKESFLERAAKLRSNKIEEEKKEFKPLFQSSKFKKEEESSSSEESESDSDETNIKTSGIYYQI